MTWVRIDEQFYNHPKLAALGAYMLPGVGLHLLALCYCNTYLTDGFVPSGQIPRLAGDLRELLPDGQPWSLVDRLVAAGLWEPAEGGYQIHDFLDYNPSRKEVEVLRQERAQAGKAGGLAKARARSKLLADGQQPASNGLPKREQKSAPVPVPFPVPFQDPKPEESTPSAAGAASVAAPIEAEILTGSENGKSRNLKLREDDPPGFGTFWARYPKARKRGDAVKAWRKINPANGTREAIMAGLDRYLASEDWAREGGRFIPHPTSWLNARCWEDDPAPASGLSPKTIGNIEVGHRFITKLQGGAV